jgi:hypothetical protein
VNSVRRFLFLAVLGAMCHLIEGSGLLTARPDLQLSYLDPGSGSFMIQALVAALAGIAVTLRTYWSRIRSFFGGAPPESEGDDAVGNPVDE